MANAMTFLARRGRGQNEWFLSREPDADAFPSKTDHDALLKSDFENSSRLKREFFKIDRYLILSPITTFY